MSDRFIVPRTFEDARAEFERWRDIVIRRARYLEATIREGCPAHQRQDAASKLAWANNYLTIAALHYATLAPEGVSGPRLGPDAG